MARPEKAAKVDEVKDKLGRAKGAVLTDFRGLNVQDLAELRRSLREQGIEYKVYKNTLVKRAADELALEALEPYLAGPTAIAFGYEDPVAVAKIVAQFARAHGQMSVKGGLVEGRVVDSLGMQTLATLPPREQLIAMLAGVLMAPIANFANVINAPVRGLAVALRAVADQKAAQTQ